MAKVEWHRGQLFPRVGFIVTNLSAKPEGVVHGSHVEDYRRAPRGRLTTRCYEYNISDKSDEGQDAPSRVKMGNPN